MNSVIPKLNKYWSIETLRSFDGKAIRYGCYHKGNLPIQRVVVFANGRSEWIEKYNFLPELLELPEDCGFVTWDHRGQGASDGDRASIDSYETFAKDMQAVIKAVAGDKPYAVVAHSMGGLISTYATLMGFIQPTHLALSGPLFLLPETLFKRNFAEKVARVLSQAPLLLYTGVARHEKSRFARNPLTHSSEAYKRMQNAPYKVPSPTFPWVDATFRACHAIFEPENLQKLSCPVLVMGGSEEKVVDPWGFSHWCQRALEHSKQAVRYEVIAGARHELFNEIPRFQQRAVALTRNWLKDFFRDKEPSLSELTQI